MPKEGYRSITLPGSVYSRFNADYDSKKDELAYMGVRSISGYVSYMLDERTREAEVLAKYTPPVQKVSFETNMAILKDNAVNRIVEVVASNGELKCMFCDRDDCIHVGFAYSMPEVNTALAQQAAGKGA